jgi:hypothetical protein
LLRDHDVGDFRVRPVIDQPSWVVAQEVETFFRQRRLGDLALFYFSGHGIKDEDGSLYFATMNTDPDSLLATTVPSEHVIASMRKCRSKQQVLILDCCYAGAFSKAMLAKGEEQVGIQERFKSEASGRVVISASDAMQVALDGTEILGEQTLSAFTRILVDGIRGGEADMDRDGHISLDELYDYVAARMEKESPGQTPTISNLDKKGRIVIAFNPRVEVPPPMPTPPDPSPDPAPAPPPPTPDPPAPPPGPSTEPGMVERLTRYAREHRRLTIALVALVVVAVIAAVVIPMPGGGGGSGDRWTLADVGTDVLDGTKAQRLDALTTLPGGESALAVGIDHGRPAVWSYGNGTWSKVPQENVDTRSGHMFAVSATGRATVAVGAMDQSSDNVDAIAWRLSGNRWNRSTCSTADCGGVNAQQMLAVTSMVGGVLIAVGRDASGGSFDGAVWRSPDDGATWQRVARNDPNLVGAPNQAMRAVVETGGRLVAVGRNGLNGAVWTSTNQGDSWTAVPAGALQSTPGHHLELLGIAVLGGASGQRLVAVGRDEGPDGVTPAAWYSDDGERWTRATIEDAGFSGQQMIGVIAGQEDLTAVGNASFTAAGMWQSSDGADWAPVHSASFSLSSGMTSIATLKDGTTFAVGSSIWVNSSG